MRQNGRLEASKAVWHSYLIWITFAAGCVLSLLRQHILPARFLYDSDRLSQFIQYPGLIARDGSYRATAFIWRMFADGGSPALVGLLTYLLFAGLLFFLVWPSAAAQARLFIVVLYCFTLPIGAVFISGYSKEVVVVVVVSLVMLSPRNLCGDGFGVVVLLTYGLLVRQYWLIAVGAYLLLRILWGLKAQAWSAFVAMFGSTVVLVIVFPSVAGQSISYYRQSILEDITVMPESAITPLLAGKSFLAELVNTWSTFLFLQMPIPLLIGGMVQIAGALVIAMLWGNYWAAVHYLARTGRLRTDRTSARCAALCLASVTAFSVFEPDYGSYLRHLAPLTPMIVYLLHRKEIARDTKSPARD